MANTIGAYPRGAGTAGRSGQTTGAYEFPLAQEQSNVIGALGGYDTWPSSIGAYNLFVYDPATEATSHTLLANDVSSASEVSSPVITLPATGVAIEVIHHYYTHLLGGHP